MYVLVVLRAGEALGDENVYAAEHERFVDSLIDRNVVLLGGGFAEPVADAGAAYVLRCADVDEARRIAGRDPFVVHGVMRADVTEWRLVGINTEAIDAAVVVTPSG